MIDIYFLSFYSCNIIHYLFIVGALLSLAVAFAIKGHFLVKIEAFYIELFGITCVAFTVALSICIECNF